MCKVGLHEVSRTRLGMDKLVKGNRQQLKGLQLRSHTRLAMAKLVKDSPRQLKGQQLRDKQDVREDFSLVSQGRLRDISRRVNRSRAPYRALRGPLDTPGSLPAATTPCGRCRRRQAHL